MKKIIFLVAVFATVLVSSCTPKQAASKTSDADTVKVDSLLHDSCSEIVDSI